MKKSILCGDRQSKDDPEVVCTRPAGHTGEHTVVMVVRWGSPDRA